MHVSNVVTEWQIVRRADRLELAGALRMADATAIWRTLQRLTESPGPTLDLDLAAVTVVDGAIMSLIVEVRGSLVTRETRSEIVRVPERVLPIVRLYHGYAPPRPTGRPRRESPIARLGSSVEGTLQRTRGVVTFWGEIVEALGSIVRTPRSIGALSPLVTHAGTDGIPIVLFLNFLVGFVMAVQTAPQLELYGAAIYVADIVGVSVTRELAPLMTAIIISGRSGAAFAAELGTMRVSEEIDALRTMGLTPMTYLVIPRVVTLALVAPVLTLLGDVTGVLGGLVVGTYSLDLHPRGYLAELRTVLVPSDVWTGLVKSSAFGGAIAFIGCQQGLRTQGAASGVGRGTTATVVYCLFTIVILDTVFTILFRGLAL